MDARGNLEGAGFARLSARFEGVASNCGLPALHPLPVVRAEQIEARSGQAAPDSIADMISGFEIIGNNRRVFSWDDLHADQF